MSPSCCLRSPPLLVLALCLLLVPSSPAMPLQPSNAASGGVPPRSDLEESASGGDIISGTDFLSVFIGAAMAPGARSGRPVVASTPAPDSNALGAYGARLIPKPKTKAVKNIPAHARLPLPPPPPPPPPPPLRADEVKVSAESQSRFQDLSHSKTPSPETVSFDPTNMDTNPLPEASARILHRVDPPKLDISKVDDTTKLATSEYDLQTSKDESTTNADSIVTTGKDNLVDLAFSDVDQETEGYKSDLTIITEVVTSREELVPTEATNVVQQESSSDDETPSVILLSNERDSDLHSSHVKAPPDDSLNAVAITIASEEETSTVRESDAANTAAPPYAPPPPPPVQQVVSVRVSSSVVQGPSPAPHTRSKPAPATDAASSVTKHDGLAQTPAAPASEEEMQRHIDASPSPSLESPQSQSAALVTEERPTNIAVQRSEFSVEESAPSSSELPSLHADTPSVFHKTVARVVEVSRNSQSAPVSYHTSVSSATSGSQVQFYSEPPSYHREVPSNVAESIRTSVVTSHQHTSGDSRPKFEHVSGVSMSGSSDESIESRMGRYGTPHHEVRISGANEHISFSSEVRSSQEKPRVTPTREHKSFRHSERPEQNFEIPERNYAQPERSYAQPERSYAQPERVYVQPVQNYGKPERNYGQPERNYGQPERNYAQPERTYSRPEQNYEVDEAVSVMTNGRAHGIQGTTPVSIPAPPSPPPPPPPAAPAPPPPIPTHEGPSVERAVGLDNSQSRDPNHKFGYVVEGRNFRKYRVEERTPDGFIVGEYGVVSHDDGSLRGVRYTADGTINPQLIYEALVKFLSL